MGFATLLDVIGSAIIGGFLLLTLFRMNNNATMNTYNFSGELTLQENLVATVEVLEWDFRKIGYCEIPANLPNPESDAILYADTSKIIFLTDLITDAKNFKGDGIPDIIEYRLGPKDENTPNPNDRVLYRIVNDDQVTINLGITTFNIKYFEDMGDSTGLYLVEIPVEELPRNIANGPTRISALQIDLRVENTATYDYNEEYNPYRHIFWRQIKLASRNLKR